MSVSHFQVPMWLHGALIEDSGLHVEEVQLAWGLQISSSQLLQNCDVRTLPYPGFPTDLQPQLMSLLTTCSGQSVVEETVFESRMRHGK